MDLLDLCSMCVYHRWVKRDHIVRPFMEELLRLYPHFRIGVFSSATVRTVNTALETLYAALQRITAQKGIGEGADTGGNAAACAAVSRAVQQGCHDGALLLRCMQQCSTSQHGRAWAGVLTSEGVQWLDAAASHVRGSKAVYYHYDAFSFWAMTARIGVGGLTHRKGQTGLCSNHHLVLFQRQDPSVPHVKNPAADGLLLPKKYDLFNVICFRDHCQPDPYVSAEPTGRAVFSACCLDYSPVWVAQH